MSHNDKIKRKKMLNFFNKIKIKFNAFSFSDLTILIWLSLIIFSIFIPWFTLPYWELTQWIFSKINWIVGIISIFLISLNLFILFSIQKKEKIKLFLNNKIEDKIIFIFSSILFIILWFNSLFTIKWLEIINNNIKFHSWLHFYIIATILFSIWVFFKVKTKEKITLISINESSEKEEEDWENKKQNVMKLPFE